MRNMPTNGRELPSVLHVVVGHGLPTYFINAVRSVRHCAPADPLLIIDNASPEAGLRHELRRMSNDDQQISVIFRSTNELQNRKVGGLYEAYRAAFEYAIAEDFDLLHILQADSQILWWDAEVATQAWEIFASNPQCVNIHTIFLPRDKRLTDEIEISSTDGRKKLKKYGLTDTGLYHLGRWQTRSMSFGESEQGHARHYLETGLEVICHPWPTDAQIPWPAVIRNGSRKGKQVAAKKEYLLKLLCPQEIVRLKDSASETWLEDVCVPWGWVCPTPMWVTDLDTMEYWAARYADARANGLRYLLPRLERRGVTADDRQGLLRRYPYQPSLLRLFLGAPLREIARRSVRAP